MSTAQNDAEDFQSTVNNLYAAVARSATRSIALYFSRPVRLFRPSKVNGWQTLRIHAAQHGHSLSPQYISRLVRQQGVSVIAKHFVPPMTVNLVLGSVLWTTYSEASSVLESHIQSPVPVAALSGAAAGAAQALVAAPAENVRFVLEGGSPATGWSYAWKEVFRGTRSNLAMSKRDELHEARQVRDWMREVSDMAGRGWDGWKWGVAKDACGFAVFFSIFEITRRNAITAKETAQTYVQQNSAGFCRRPVVQKHGPRTVHALTLVTGGAVAGFAYELSCRPWDAARKALRVDRVVAAHEHHSAVMILLHKARTEGWVTFFRQAGAPDHETYTSPLQRRLHTLLRTLGRVGPWGVGFLVWEAFGPGLS